MSEETPAEASAPAHQSEDDESHATAADLQANCPVCRAGVVKRKFTKCGLIWAIFFPFGLICCFLLSTKRCNKCGYNEGL